MAEPITHYADNWKAISEDLNAADPFTSHIRDKADYAIGIGKPGRKITETVEYPLAKEIRASAKKRKLEEAAGE